METSTITGIIRGTFCSEAYSVFLNMLKSETEMLERLFEREKTDPLSSIFSSILIMISMLMLK